DGWLGLSRETLSFSTPRRFVPAHYPSGETHLRLHAMIELLPFRETLSWRRAIRAIRNENDVRGGMCGISGSAGMRCGRRARCIGCTKRRFTFGGGRAPAATANANHLPSRRAEPRLAPVVDRQRFGLVTAGDRAGVVSPATRVVPRRRRRSAWSGRGGRGRPAAGRSPGGGRRPRAAPSATWAAPARGR